MIKFAIYGLFVGFCATIFILHFIIWIGRREKMYLTMSLICLSYVFYYLATWILPEAKLIGQIPAIYLTLPLVEVSCILFSASIWDLKKFYIVLYSPFFILYLIVPLIFLFNNYHFLFMLISALYPVLLIIILTIKIVKSRDGFRLSIYILFTILLFFGCVYTVVRLNGIPLSSIWMMATMLLLLIAFTGFLISRINQDFRELISLQAGFKIKLDEKTQELADKKEQHRRFFGFLAHESKTSIFIIKNTLDILISKHGISEETNIIKQQLEKLSNNTKNYLESNRTSNYFTNIELFDLSGIVREKASFSVEAARTKNIKLISEIEPGLYLKADFRAIETILDNLIDNAMKYTDMGTIKVVLKKDGKKGILTIEDTGVGIKKEDYDNVFKQFFRSPDTTKDGTGQGLYIVDNLVTSLNGRIDLDSQLERGSVFVITLPLYFPKKNELSGLTYKQFGGPVPVNHNSQTEIDIQKKNLFIVDDNKDILDYFNKSLREYNLFLFGSGNQLLNKINNLPRPDLIISDYMMNDGNGAELLKEIRNIYNNIPFMLITAHASDEIKEQCLNDGATDYLEKNFTLDELKAKIKNFISLAKDNENVVSLKDVELDDFEADVKEKAGFYQLSQRQIECLVLYLSGKDTHEIAHEMGDIKESTVRRHRSNVCEKIGLKDRHALLKLFGYKAQ